MPRQRSIVVSGTSATIVEALGVALTGLPGLEVLSTAMSESELLELVTALRPDAVLVYVPVLDPTTIEVVDRLKMHDPAVRVVMLAGRPSMQALAYAAKAGAAACLSLNSSLSDLAEAVRADATDIMLVDSASLFAFTEARELEGGERRNTALTRRELEVLNVMADGSRPPVIAAKLGISIHTVRGHVESVLRKLGAHSQLEAVAMARDLGLVGSGPSSRDTSSRGRRQPPKQVAAHLRSMGPGYQGQLLGWRRNA
jgi:DNA-binding NarL/FixJ family response regulator